MTDKDNWPIWMRPAVDHTMLSPSGHASKRARAAALKREHDRLFPPGYWDEPVPTETRAAKVRSLRAHAARLRDLADQGMTPRKFRRIAQEADAEADTLES